MTEPHPRAAPPTSASAAGGSHQLRALRRDTHDAMVASGQLCGLLCDELAEYLFDRGWRHPFVLSTRVPLAVSAAIGGHERTAGTD